MSSSKRILKWLAGTTILLFLMLVLLFDIWGLGRIRPPAPTNTSLLTLLEQNWKPDDIKWFHHASQGTKVMKLSWFLALEQPELRMLGTPSLLHERNYLERFGFLPSLNADGKTLENELPIGFAIARDFHDPHANSATCGAEPEGTYDVVGLTCAACHTGQINYKGSAIRVEGAPAMIDLGSFQNAVRRALAYTIYVPGRFSRFAERVYPDCTEEQSQALWEELNALIEAGLQEKLYTDRKQLYALQAGPGRTDAVGLIGNRAFKDLNNQENLAVADAPVNFPPLWDTPWFDWVQYNASIRPPLVRNIGEALGVGALVITNPRQGESLYDSTVDLQGLHEIELQIAGSAPYAGLRSPVWPTDIFGAPDETLTKIGQELYGKHCLYCHHTVEELQTELALDSAPKLWTSYDPANLQSDQVKLMILKVCNLHEIGTDPAQSLNLYKRVVATPDGMLSVGKALENVTAQVRERKFKELNLTPEQRREYDGYRYLPEKDSDQQGPPSVVAKLGYKARPLNGVWATAPYLHNGSVPNLYEILLPVAKRSQRFYTGGREFDVEKVGYKSDLESGYFELDTSLPGNSHSGHEFRNLTLEELEAELKCVSLPTNLNDRWELVLGLKSDAYERLSETERFSRVQVRSREVLHEHHGSKRIYLSGVLGAEFTEDERRALIAYLKTL